MFSARTRTHTHVGKKLKKGKRKRSGKLTCYRVSCISGDQKRFTISEVAADRHELMIAHLLPRVSEQFHGRLLLAG